MHSAQAAIKVLKQYLGKRQPKIAIVLGSGLGQLAEQLRAPVFIDYKQLPGFPRSTVVGHKGRLILGQLGGRDVICMQGRVHYYEGHDLAHIALPVRVFQSVGCETLLLTNAAGSLKQAMPPGSLMLVQDHINWLGLSPLIGPNDDRIGPRFFDMTHAYDPKLRQLLLNAASSENIPLHQGVYLWAAGPAFETPAEIKLFRLLGADAVGMSTVPECLAARHCGMKVVAISSITNLAAGISAGEITHEETLQQGNKVAGLLSRLIIRFLTELPA